MLRTKQSDFMLSLINYISAAMPLYLWFIHVYLQCCLYAAKLQKCTQNQSYSRYLMQKPTLQIVFFSVNRLRAERCARDRSFIEYNQWHTTWAIRQAGRTNCTRRAYEVTGTINGDRRRLEAAPTINGYADNGNKGMCARLLLSSSVNLCCVVLCSACLGPFQCSMLKRTHLPLQLSQSCLCFRQCLFTLREDFCQRSSVRWPREQTITIENEASSQRARQKQKTFGRNDNTKDNWNKENSSGVFFSVVVILFSTNTSILARNGRICCNEECLVDIERFLG